MSLRIRFNQKILVISLLLSTQLTHSSVPYHDALDGLHCGAESGHDIIKKSAITENT